MTNPILPLPELEGTEVVIKGDFKVEIVKAWVAEVEINGLGNSVYHTFQTWALVRGEQGRLCTMSLEGAVTTCAD